jgi:N-methylhydantoinase B
LSLADGVRFAAYSDHHERGARGLFGGGDGSLGEFVLEPRAARPLKLPCVAAAVLDKGDRMRIVVGGGGGYGEPNPSAT